MEFIFNTEAISKYRISIKGIKVKDNMRKYCTYNAREKAKLSSCTYLVKNHSNLRKCMK